jgi:hypothetical protein
MAGRDASRSPRNVGAAMAETTPLAPSSAAASMPVLTGNDTTANMNTMMAWMATVFAAKTDISSEINAAIVPVTARLDSMETRISKIENSNTPLASPPNPPRGASAAPNSTSYSSAVLLAPGQSRSPVANGVVRNRVWFKGWTKPQTAFYFKALGEKILKEHNVNIDDAIIRNFGMNRQFSIDLLLGDTAARSLLSTFRENPTTALDSRNGSTLRIYAVQDRSIEERQKLGRLSPLFDKVTSLLKAKGKWNEDTMAPSSHANSQTFFIKKDEIYYSLFAVKAGVLTPDLSECALLDISADEVDKILASIPAQ